MNIKPLGDRVVTSDQAIGTLWEYRANDNATQSLYSKVGKALQEQLEESGAGDLILSSRGSKSINVDKVEERPVNAPR